MQEKNNILSQANELLKKGEIDEARQLLISCLRSNSNSTEAWWLLSQTITDKEQQKDCLKKILELDPNHIAAHARLEHFNTLVSPANGTLNDRQKQILRKHKQSKPLPIVPKKKPAPQKVKKNQKINKGIIALVIFVFSLGILGIGYFSIIILKGTNSNDTPSMAQIIPPTPTRKATKTLYPTWTPTPTSTRRPTKTPTSTPVPTETKYIIGPSVGLYAPDFTLPSANGGRITLSDYKGHPVVLVFLVAGETDYSKRALNSLNTIYKSYKSEGLYILAIDLFDSRSYVNQVKSAYNIPFPVLLAANTDVQEEYNVTYFPFYYFINTDGKISTVSVRVLDETELEPIIKKLIAAGTNSP